MTDIEGGTAARTAEAAARAGELGRRTGGGWPAVGALAAATFTVVTSEMLPVGLLTPIGRELRVSDGTAGLTLTVTGLVAAVSAPLVTLLVGRRDRRVVLAVLTGALAAANLLAAYAPNVGVLLAARVLVGLGMGGVWAIAAGLAVRLVPATEGGGGDLPGLQWGRGGLGAGGAGRCTFVGELGGWRASFVAMAAVCGAVAIALAVLLPPLPEATAVRLKGVLGLLRRRACTDRAPRGGVPGDGALRGVHVCAAGARGVAGAGAGQIGTLLLAFGVAGLAGNFAAGAGAARSPRAALLVICGVLAGAVLLLPLLGRGAGVPGAAALVAVWGLAYGGVSVSTQTG